MTTFDSQVHIKLFVNEMVDKQVYHWYFYTLSSYNSTYFNVSKEIQRQL